MSRISEALEDVADAVIEQKDYLTELDAKIGDGDHGLNMARGMQAALDAVDKLPHDDEPAPGICMPCCWPWLLVMPPCWF